MSQMMLHRWYGRRWNLPGFARVFIPKGESRTVRFKMKATQFAFLNEAMEWTVEKGTMTVKVGASSADIRLEDQFTITQTRVIDGKTRGFYAKTEVWRNRKILPGAVLSADSLRHVSAPGTHKSARAFLFWTRLRILHFRQEK